MRLPTQIVPIELLTRDWKIRQHCSKRQVLLLVVPFSLKYWILRCNAIDHGSFGPSQLPAKQLLTAEHTVSGGDYERATAFQSLS